MSVRVIAVLLVLGVGILAYVSWTNHPSTPSAAAPQAQTPSGEPAPSQGTPGSAAMPPAQAPDPGLVWKAPPRWHKQPDRPMRVATYAISKADADSEDAECAVFYFGPGQGGDTEANFDRWIGQFEAHGKIARASETHDGMSVKRVEVDGTYLAPSGPMMESSGSKKGWMLKGAIVEGPNGNIFFKFTGPKAALEASAKEFDGMLASLRKG